MRTHRTRCHFIAALASATLLAGAAGADTWFPPTRESYLSADGAWRLTVTPRAISSPLAYFEDKVEGREPAGTVFGDASKHARGSMEHLEDGTWKAVWEKPLLNEVSPVSAIVSRAGRTATFDNWHSMGYGPDAIVIYDDHGQVVRALGLEDFLPADYIRALPRTVSSMQWGQDHRFSDDGRSLILRVVVPSVATRSPTNVDARQYIELEFDVVTGRSRAPDDATWSRALASVRQVNEHTDRLAAEQKARFIAPLSGPATASASDEQWAWHEYLREAFFRLDRDWQDGFPVTKVLLPSQHADHEASVGWLKDAFRGDPVKSDVIMIGSPSQDDLARRVAEIAADVPRGSLQGTRIYVAADDAHTAVIARALTRTGATYVQLDPGKPIPQRKARLEAWLGANP